MRRKKIKLSRSIPMARAKAQKALCLHSGVGSVGRYRGVWYVVTAQLMVPYEMVAEVLDYWNICQYGKPAAVRFRCGKGRITSTWTKTTMADTHETIKSLMERPRLVDVPVMRREGRLQLQWAEGIKDLVVPIEPNDEHGYYMRIQQLQLLLHPLGPASEGVEYRWGGYPDMTGSRQAGVVVSVNGEFRGMCAVSHVWMEKQADVAV